MTWDDDKRTFRSRPDIPTDERLTADEWNAHVSDQKDHAERHEAGGVDELVVDGLAGVLADPQPPQEEAVEDFVAGLLGGGDKVTTTYDDGAGSISVNTSALDAEEVDDRVDGLLSAGDKLSLTYDDANDTLTIDTSALDTEEVEDAVNTLVAGGDGVTTSYDDANNTLTLDVTVSDLAGALLSGDGSNNLQVNEGDISHDAIDQTTISEGDHRTTEQVQDIVDALLEAGDKLSLTYDDANDTLTVNTSALDTEEVEDAVNALIAGGDGIATSYDDANDTLTLSIPDNSVTAAMLAEAYYTQTEADSRFYNVSGDTLEGDVDANTNTITDAGHDEVDVPQTFDLVTDDFERASLGSDYVGDTQDAKIQSSVVLEGQRSLEISPSSKGSSRVSRSPVNTPQLGDSFEAKFHVTSPDASTALAILSSDPQIRYANSTAVQLFLRPDKSKIAISQYLSGSVVKDADVDAPVPAGETLTAKVTLGVDREISLTVFDSAGTELGTVTTTLDSRIPKSGAVQYEALNFSTPPTQYFDGPFITRRLGEETRERQRGSTETSKLQTRGGVGAGPRILPENRAAEIMSDVGITSALAAGTEVSYGLQLNGRKMLTIFGEADGSGGLQNPAVDFESRQLKDVSNNQTADSMTANPEADTEDGFIEVELGGTAFQIPVYQA